MKNFDVMPCNHQQCSICLKRECMSDFVRPLKWFGSVLACPPCIHKAVNWAYESASKWGGDYGPDVCGKTLENTAKVG